MSATAALEQAMEQKKATKIGPYQPMVAFLKRSRSSIGSFDLREFEEASKQIADSIAFPRFEWSFNEEGDEEDDDVFSFERPTKRSCRGFVRSKASGNLSSLRRGSAGSLS